MYAAFVWITTWKTRDNPMDCCRLHGWLVEHTFQLPSGSTSLLHQCIRLHYCRTTPLGPPAVPMTCSTSRLYRQLLLLRYIEMNIVVGGPLRRLTAELLLVPVCRCSNRSVVTWQLDRRNYFLRTKRIKPIQWRFCSELLHSRAVHDVNRFLCDSVIPWRSSLFG